MTHRNVEWPPADRPQPEPPSDAPAPPPSLANPPPVSYRTRELAITYGLGARLHYGERHWDDIREELALGWERLRGAEQVPWALVEADVEGAWRLVPAQ